MTSIYHTFSKFKGKNFWIEMLKCFYYNGSIHINIYAQISFKELYMYIYNVGQIWSPQFANFKSVLGSLNCNDIFRRVDIRYIFHVQYLFDLFILTASI